MVSKIRLKAVSGIYMSDLVFSLSMVANSLTQNFTVVYAFFDPILTKV